MVLFLTKMIAVAFKEVSLSTEFSDGFLGSGGAALTEP